MNQRTLTIQITDVPQTCGIEETARLQCIVGTLDSGRILLEADFIDGGPPVESAVAAFVVRWINEMYFEVIQRQDQERPPSSCWAIIDRFKAAVLKNEAANEEGMGTGHDLSDYLKARDELANAMQ